MKARTFFLLVMASVCLGTFPAGITIGGLVSEARQARASLDEVRPLIDQTLAKLGVREVTVGSTATQMHPDYPRIGSMTIQNTSATCIACADDTVTATTGLLVGDGCAAGQTLAMDVANAYCIRVGGSDVTGVDVIFGLR